MCSIILPEGVCMVIAFLSLFHWQDIIEIALLATAFYRFSLWLVQDKSKNLLGTLYLYCFLFITTAFFNLATISTLLLSFSPAAFLMLIILHQETLQKNFIMSKNTLPAKNTSENSDWIASLIRSCLLAFNSKKDILCIIEHRDAIREFIDSSFFIETELQKGLLDLFIESTLFNAQQYVWIRSNGTLVALNSSIKLPASVQMVPDSQSSVATWVQEALLITQKTDVCIFKANAQERQFEVIIQGKHYQQLTTNGFIALLNKYYSVNPLNKAGINHDTQRKNNATKQFTS